MSLDVFLALLGFSFVASGTPGPNTLMLLASGVNFGFRRTLPHMFGIFTGFGLLLTAVGLGMGELFVRLPAAFLVLKAAGALYMLYLAWRIANASRVDGPRAAARPMTAMEALVFQWLNPKAWIMGVVAMATYTSVGDFHVNVALVVGAFLLVSFPCMSLWTGFGAAMQRFLANPVWLKRFNLTMAAALVLSLWPMLR